MISAPASRYCKWISRTRLGCVSEGRSFSPGSVNASAYNQTSMEFRSIVGVFPCQVHWGDCDPAGIIFYPTYFRWMDAATWAFFESVGYTPRRMREEHLSMPLVSADCQFL